MPCQNQRHDHIREESDGTALNKTEILRFINRFRGETGAEVVVNRFTEGCCYWFAYILHARFPFSTIIYSEKNNHFATEIGGVLFDIRGELENKEGFISWEEYKTNDPTHAERIVRDCIEF